MQQQVSGLNLAIRNHPSRLAWGAAAMMILATSACQAPPQKKNPKTTVDSVAVEEYEKLAYDLQSFGDFFQATLDRAATDIERQASTKQQRRAAATWRLRMVALFRSTAYEVDLTRGLLDVWSLCRRMLDYFQTTEGRTLFGREGGPIALAAAKDIVTGVEELARKHIPPELFETTQEQVEEFSREHPLSSDFSESPDVDFSDRTVPSGEWQRILSLPFRSISSVTVGGAPEAIREFSRSVDRFTDVVEDIPASARWQAQHLAMNLEELPSMVSATASVKKIADSTEEITKIAEEMPQRWREQAEVLLATVEDAQPQLQTTLGQAQRSADSIQSAAREAKDMLSGVDTASKELTRAADAVTLTMQEIRALVAGSRKDQKSETGSGTEQVDPSIHPSPAQTEKDKSFSFQAVTESAAELGDTTEKLRQLLTDVRGFVESETTDQQTNLGKALNAAAAEFQGIIDHAAKRAVQLLGLFFTLLVVYRLIRMKMEVVRPAATS